MYICLCKNITDQEIRNAVMDGAESFRKVRKQLGVATECGQCACHAKALVDETVAEARSLNSGLFYAA